jgi:hypothetical protein
MNCLYCGIHREYYVTAENASRQNCRESIDGYHDFVYYPWLHRMLDCLTRRKRRNGVREDLIQHRRQRRPNTI